MVKTTDKKGLNKVQVSLGALLLVAIVGLGIVSYGYYNATQKIDLLTQAQNEMSQEEIDALLDDVAVHMLLPTDETPAIATIFDAAKLAETQAFFEQAVDGDKVIIYSDKAIIFRPKPGLIINVGPVITDAPPVELGEDGEPIYTEEIAEEDPVDEPVEEPVYEEVIETEEVVNSEEPIEDNVETVSQEEEMSE